MTQLTLTLSTKAIFKMVRAFALIAATTRSIALGALCLVPLVAQSVGTASTVPEGVITFDIKGGTVVSPGTTTFSNPLVQPFDSTKYSGISLGSITGVTATTITTTSGGWIVSTLAQPETPHFVRIKSGASAGCTFKITANTDSVLTIDNRGVNLIDAARGILGSTFEILQGYTLSEFFGKGTIDGSNGTVLGGANETVSDTITFHDGSNWVNYYYRHTGSDSSPDNKWMQGRNVAPSVALYPDMGILYTRKAVGYKIIVEGSVPSTDTRPVAKKSGTTFTTIGYPTDLTVSSLLDPTNPMVSTDRIFVYKESNWHNLRYEAATGKWFSGRSDASTFTIPAGTPIIITKIGVVPGVDVWKFPLPYAP